MMKIAFIPVLLVAATAYAVNVSPVMPLCMTSMRAQKSSRFVRITTQANPLKGTRVDFYSYKLNSQSALDATSLTFLFSLNPDEEGRIETPELSPGQYCVAAMSANGQSAELLLNVIPGNRARTTSFTMHLVAQPAPAEPPPLRPQWTPADEQMPMQKRVSAFRGTVTDVSGAVIPEAFIDVVKKGTEGKEHVAQLKADSYGRFSGELPSGFYIGFFYARYFKDQIIPFEITKDGTGELDVVLPIPNPPVNVTKLELPNNAERTDISMILGLERVRTVGFKDFSEEWNYE